jgi:superfamily II DNA or RNA helicase
LFILHKLKVKTLIVVHKSFLMHQWKERIEQFLPTARVGTLQQDKIDIDNKDIVIAMLQSICLRDYGEIFDSFGLTIFDECHHLSSEVFNKSLQRIGTKYNLGLSATPDRADGLSKVFEWWLGPIVYQGKSQGITDVNVYQIQIKDKSDENYCRQVYTKAGQLSSTSMVTNLCNCEDRTLLITSLLALICEDKKRQILVLSSRRKHLDDLYVILKNHCSIGYYVGGMKQADLKESESKQIVLGTYSMSSEGLDIKSLNTLVLASPMTNITQSVGRILRCVHEDVVPEIYDICDMFSCFARQSYKRKKFYNESKYKVYLSVIKSMNDFNPMIVKQNKKLYVKSTKCNIK